MKAANRTSDFHQDCKPIRRQAAEWLARRQGGLTSDDQFEFDCWLAADPRHEVAMTEMESAWDSINAPVAAGEGEALRRGLTAHVQQQTRRRQRRLFASLGLAAAAAFAFTFLPWEGRSVADSALAPTMALRPDKVTLPDGSTVEFNAGAEIAVDFTAEKRGVRLVRGEAHFAVTKDANRPFVVSAGTFEVKAVGTAFAVRLDPKRIDVLVTEGRVAVERPSTEAEIGAASASTVAPIYLGVGVRLALPADLPSLRTAKVEPLSPAEVARALAWRGHRLEFTDTPLAEAVALFNRQNKLQIAIANRTDEARCINGVFWADDPAGFARLLEASLGLTMTRQGESIVLGNR